MSHYLTSVTRVTKVGNESQYHNIIMRSKKNAASPPLRGNKGRVELQVHPDFLLMSRNTHHTGRNTKKICLHNFWRCLWEKNRKIIFRYGCHDIWDFFWSLEVPESKMVKIRPQTEIRHLSPLIPEIFTQKFGKLCLIGCIT